MIVYLDTNIVIYTVEKHPFFGPKSQAWLGNIQASGNSLMISDLTRMECLVGPLKSGKTALATAFRTFFTLANVQVVAVTAAVCDKAASVRATNNFKPMDALHLAAAFEHGADVFLTADARLNSFTGLTVDILR